MKLMGWHFNELLDTSTDFNVLQIVKLLILRKKRVTAYLVYTKRKNNQAVKNVSWIVFTQARPTTDSHVQMSIMNKSTMTNNSK